MSQMNDKFYFFTYHHGIVFHKDFHFIRPLGYGYCRGFLFTYGMVMRVASKKDKPGNYY